MLFTVTVFLQLSRALRLIRRLKVGVSLPAGCWFASCGCVPMVRLFITYNIHRFVVWIVCGGRFCKTLGHCTQNKADGLTIGV